MTGTKSQPWLSLSFAALVGAGLSMVVSQWTSSSNSSNNGRTETNVSTDVEICASPEALVKIIQHRRSIFPKQYSRKPVPKSVLDDMLEAARWAPSHKLTEAWSFVVFGSLESRRKLGRFLAEQYKASCKQTGKTYSETKFQKKVTNCEKSSFVVSILCINADPRKNPWWEEVASVAMAVQNMLLVATAHKIGAYWSSGSVHDTSDGSNIGHGIPLTNPASTRAFLGLTDESRTICLGWMFVGDYYGDDDGAGKSWPTSQRKDLSSANGVAFR